MENRDDFVDENDNKIDDREEATLGMTEIDGFDFERALMLMSIMEKVANVAPKSMAISGLAAAALNEMNEEAKDIAKRRAAEFAKLEAKRVAFLAAEQREREAEAVRQAEADAQAADAKARARAIPVEQPVVPSRAIPRGTQTESPAPSRTNQIATDNARRV